MITYCGDRTLDGVIVTAGGQPIDPAFRIRTFSSMGFEWGYEGTAPAQLSLALLAHHLADDAAALAAHDAFMRKVVANFGNEWQITGDNIDAALAAIQQSSL